jgi:hypothetical protein
MGKQGEMSRKLVTIIQDIKGFPGKYKRVLQAWASFANNDGTNIFASKEAVAQRAGVSRWTVYQNTEALEAVDVMLRSRSHVCKTKDCNQGGTHFTSQHGQYTVVYRIDVALLENPTVLLQKLADPTVVKPRKVTVGKSRKGTVAKLDTTQVLKETPAPLGKDDSSALTSGSEKESKQASPSLPSVATAPPRTALASRENQNPDGPCGLVANQDQEQPQTVVGLYENLGYGQAGWLLLKIQPNLTDAAVAKHFPCAERILTFFGMVDENYQAMAAEMVLNWNRAHRSGKYASKDDKKLLIRTAAQYLRALESDNAFLLNDYDFHEFEQCEVCKERGYTHYRQFIKELVQKELDRAEQGRQEEIRKTMCAFCKQKPFGQMTIQDAQMRLNHKLCDDCYDEEYEREGLYNINLLQPRPGYVPKPEVLKRWFRQHGKEGNWTIKDSEVKDLDVSEEHVETTLRRVYQEKQKVSKDQFIAMLLTAARKVQYVEEIEHCDHCKQELPNHWNNCPFHEKNQKAAAAD